MARRAAAPLLGIVIFAATWEVLARVVVRSELLFAPLSSTLVALWQLARSGELAADFVVSAEEFVVGYITAVIVGIIAGAAFAMLPMLRRMFAPIVLGAYSTPLIAITPLLIMMFGLGLGSKIVIVFLMAVFPIMINTESGLRSVDADYIDTARAFRATRLQIVWHVILPASLMTIVAGLRLAVGRGIIGVVVGEIFGATQGLGFLIVQYSNSFRTARTLAIVLLLAVVGIGANAVLEWLERFLSPWRAEHAR